MSVTAEILKLLAERGDSQYGREAVTQRQHALQAAWAAERAGSDSALIVAALLHDVGHMLHDLPDDAPDQGIDDRHERSGYRWLAKHFGPEVSEPVALHVAAKRYLCTVEPAYLNLLSEPSIQSLQLQGGAMTPEEVREFERSPHFRRAVQLRRWDDEAKVVGLATPPAEHFSRHLEAALAQ